MSYRSLIDLAIAVIDRRTVDWAGAMSSLRSADDLVTARELQIVARVATPDAVPLAPARSRRLPTVLEAVRVLCIPLVAIGTTGLVAAMVGLRAWAAGMLAIATVAAFAVPAGSLDVGGIDRRTRALSTLYWTLAVSVSAPGIPWLARSLGGVHAKWLSVLGGLHPEAFFAAALWVFAREFPSAAVFSSIDRACTVGFRLAAAVGVGLFVANLLPRLGIAVDHSSALAALQRTGPAITLFWILLFAAATPALALMAWRAWRASPNERARARLLLYAIAFGIGPLVLMVLFEGLLPAVARVMNTPVGRSWGNWIVFPPLLSLPMLTAYVIATDDVLEIRVAVHRGLRYLLARWLVGWGTAIPVVLLVAYLYRNAERPLQDALGTGVGHTLVWASVVGLVLLALRGPLIKILDHFLLAGQETPSGMLSQMTEDFKNARTPGEVMSILADAGERTLQSPAEAYLMVNGRIIPTRSDTGPGPGSTLIPVLLGGSREPCVVSERSRDSLYMLLTRADREWISARGIAILAPVLSARRHGELFGIVAFTQRRNALGFSSSDMKLLGAASAAASLACDAIKPSRNDDGDARIQEVAAECDGCGVVRDWSDTSGPCSCDGGWIAASLPRRLLDRDDVDRRLGAGGMGVVYRATYTRLGRADAIKTLARLSEDAAARLLAEARTMASLTHSHVAMLYGAELWQDTPLLLMEYLDGGTLARRLRERRHTMDEALSLMVPLLDALEYMHEAGVIHGDIKPSNIGFTGRGTPKFLDFGVSRAIASERVPAGSDDFGAPGLAGTLAYMPPAVRDGGPIGPGVDVWSLSLVLLEVATGVNPLATSSTSADARARLTTALVVLPPEVDVRAGGWLRHALGSAPLDALTASDMRLALAASAQRPTI